MLLKTSTKDEIVHECSQDPYGGLDPLAMIQRIASVYRINVPNMGHERCIRFVSEIYNFSIETVEDIVEKVEQS